MLKLSPKVLLVLAALCSVLTVFFAYDYLRTSTRTVAPPSRTVVVAARDIPARTLLTQDMVKVVNIPLDLAQTDSFTENSSVIGKQVNAAMAAGDQITVKKIIGSKAGGGFAATIPPDKRALTIAVNEITGVAGRVKSGDSVDIVATFDKGVAGETVSKLLLQNVLVLTGNSAEQPPEPNEKKENVKQTMVTLAVTPDEASQLVLAVEKGKIYLALRPDAATPDIIIARNVFAADLGGGRPALKESVPMAPLQPAVNAIPPAAPGIQVIRGTRSEMVSVR